MSTQSDVLRGRLIKEVDDLLARERDTLERDTDRTFYALALRKGKVQGLKAARAAVDTVFANIDKMYEGEG